MPPKSPGKWFDWPRLCEIGICGFGKVWPVANKGNFVALPTETLNEYARSVEADIQERAETIASLLFIASLFDTDVYQAAAGNPNEPKKAVRKALPGDGDSGEIITGIIEFAKLLNSLPPGQNLSLPLQGSVDAAKKWYKESDDVVIGKIAYRNLDHRLVKTIYDSHFRSRTTVKKTEVKRAPKNSVVGGTRGLGFNRSSFNR